MAGRGRRRRRSKRKDSRTSGQQASQGVATASAHIARGIVKWFNRSKGYGFISCSDGTEVFVHESAVILGRNSMPLAKGRKVEFEIRDTPRGKQAFSVIVRSDSQEVTEQAAATRQQPTSTKPRSVRFPSSWRRSGALFIYTYTIYDKHTS